MSDLNRKMKNPLLTAAGQGFPFEEHEIPNLLIPVAQPVLTSQDGNANPTPFPSGNDVLSTIELDNRDGSNGTITKTETLSEISLNDQCYDESSSRSLTESIDSLNLTSNPTTPPLSFPIANTIQNSSYRLGNQRRLRYVPPPNLTSSHQAPLQPPITQPFTPAPAPVSQEIFTPTVNQPPQAQHVPSAPPVPAEFAPAHVQERVPLVQPNLPQVPVNTPPSGLSNYFSASNQDNDIFSSCYAPPQTQNLLSNFNAANEAFPRNQSTNSSVDVQSTNFYSSNINSPFTRDESDNEKRDLVTVDHRGPQDPIKLEDSSATQSNLSVQSTFYNPANYNPPCQVPTPPSFSFDSVHASPGLEQPAFVNCMMPEPTGSATLNPTQISVSQLAPGRVHTETIIPASLENLASANKIMYRPVYYHWFHCREIETKIIWQPFSMHDSLNLEQAFNSTEISAETVIATDGGRYDVEIIKRQRRPVYWSATPTQVRRCSWFFKGPTESRYTPYEEQIAARLEEEYKQACLSNSWNRRVELSNNEHIIFHSATVQVHYTPATSLEFNSSWSNSYNVANRPKLVKRGLDELNIDEGEPEAIDHLLFLVHGIGSACDLKFRSVEEVVDEFRSISLQLVQTHYRTETDHGRVHRIEVLPISWHSTLHSEDTGIDNKLKTITLESIPKLRHFTNDTLLDILFYTSPVYCQTIMQAVGNEMNKQYALFKERNPLFNGSVYLGGHSLGSLILFDLLCHQKPIVDKPKEDVTSENENSEDEDTVGEMQTIPRAKFERRTSRRISYVMGSAGTGQPFIVYPHLNFYPKAFFAFGSPIGMFVTTRGIDNLGSDFRLPTCPAFFNIFHPFDPVAYRIEPMVNPEAYKYPPQLIPHHKGRKRMHLELKETMARVGADLKQKILNSMKVTWNSVFQLTSFYQPDNKALEQEIEKVVEEEFKKSSRLAESSANSNNDKNEDNDSSEAGRYYHDDRLSDAGEINIKMGKLNGGRRIDYVLQEAPFEYINEYIFALTSHVESEDTMLLILKEIYGSNGIQADAQLPQQLLTPTSVSFSSSDSLSSPSHELPSTSASHPHPLSTSPALQGVDPTAPITQKSVGPPPISGFVRKS
ncbi:Similar to Ddhd2: Phospholipase DDHD2 (Mus musculus) [Cotesia congregata]|uniref:Similar to Ddhd2: Phospholipase DDHD2 (Mus musculus) n=1 Tax=Cotesia congregata TaxID=51543 RepID=A0A8J2H611_COTCN|nr:Similar to Ddhd2: Phospholipase DDHD2 (Mus musculus) [Cotesia congregata]